MKASKKRNAYMYILSERYKCCAVQKGKISEDTLYSRSSFFKCTTEQECNGNGKVVGLLLYLIEQDLRLELSIL